MAISLNLQGKGHQALIFALKATQIAKEIGSIILQVRSMAVEANCQTYRMGRYQQSALLCSDSLLLLEALGMDAGNSRLYQDTLIRYAGVLFEKTEYHASRMMYKRVFGESSELSSLDDIALGRVHPSQLRGKGFAMISIIQVDISTNHHDSTIFPRLEVARKLFLSINDHRNVLICDFLLGRLHWKLEKYESAEEILEKCLHSSGHTHDASVQAECLRALLELALLKSDKASALRYSVLHLAGAQLAHEIPQIYRSLLILGNVFSLEHKETALVLFEIALGGFTSMDIHRGKVAVIFDLSAMLTC